jgi:hypothetical protein
MRGSVLRTGSLMTIDRNLLDPGEAVIWSGSPKPLIYALRLSVVPFLFGIVFFGFSLFWMQIAWTAGTKNDSHVWLFGVPFVLAGAGLVLSPFWHFWRGARTIYMLSNRRALTIVNGPFARRLSVPLHKIRFVDVRLSELGPGDIYFRETATPDGEGGTTTRREGFVAITDVLAVERFLRSEIDRASSTQQRYAP